MPHAFGSSGGQVGTGSILVRDAVTLFEVEAEEVWVVVAAAPVRTRTTTKARIIVFMKETPWNICG
jgi:hypothetical protein